MTSPKPLKPAGRKGRTQSNPAKARGVGEQAIRAWLAENHQFIELPPEMVGYTYAGMADFLLKHGRYFEARPKPKGYRRGRQKQCFGNSVKLALRNDRLRYVEGVAAIKVAPAQAILIHHSWVIDEADKVVEVTLANDVAVGYFGVVLPVPFVMSQFGGNGVFDNWPDRWPIYKAPFRGYAANRNTRPRIKGAMPVGSGNPRRC